MHHIDSVEAFTSPTLKAFKKKNKSLVLITNCDSSNLYFFITEIKKDEQKKTQKTIKLKVKS